MDAFFAQCLGELCVCLIRNTGKKQLQISRLWADVAEPQPNKLGDLSVLEHIKIHTPMSPEGNTCQGVSQAPY